MRTSVRAVARIATASMLFTFVVSHGSGLAQDAGTDSSRAIEWRAVERSLQLVSIDRRIRVALVDPEFAPDPDAIARLDAFVVRNARGDLRPVIYLNRLSPIVQKACAGDPRAIEELAAVIHHEARHLAGDSETEARFAEQRFLQSIAGKGPGAPRAASSLQTIIAEWPPKK